MTELLDDPVLSLDPSAATASWCVAGIDAVQSRLRSGSLPYRIIIDHGRTVQATLVDTFDWRVLDSGRIALLVEGEGNGGESTPQLNIIDHTYGRDRRDRHTEVLETVAATTAALASAPTLKSVLAVGDSFEGLSASVAPRALLQMGYGELSLRRGRLVNDSGKTEAIVDEITVDGMPDHASRDSNTLQRFLLLRPLRGYHRVAAIPLGTPVGVDGVIDALAARARRQPFDFDTRLNLPVRCDDDPHAAHRHVVSRLVGTMAAVRPGIGRVADPEFLHDYRVSLRRLRSYLKESGLGPSPTTTTAATRPMPEQAWRAVELMDAVWEATGVARDLDVFLERRNHYLRAAPAPLRDEVDLLFDRIADMRDASYAALFARLPVGYEPALVEELLARGPAWDPAWKRSSAARLDAQAIRWVQKRERKFLKLVTRLQDAYTVEGTELDDEKIHAARKAAKRYRYLHEIFLPVLDDRRHTSKRVKRLRKLQNLLGSYNDLVVEEARFHEILTQRDAGSYGDVRAGTAYMLAKVEREKDAAREQVLNELSKEVT